MDNYNKLLEIQEINQSQRRMGPSAVKDKFASELYNEMLKYRRISEEAPTNAANAEEKYYTFVDGDYVDKALVRSAPKVRFDIEKRHQDVLDTVNSSIDIYESQRTYLKNISDVFFNFQEKMNYNLKLRDDNLADETTNQQRVYYLNQEYETIDHANHVLFLITVGCIGVLLDNIYEKRLWANDKPVFFLEVCFILLLLFVESRWFNYVMVRVFALIGLILSYRPIIYATF